MKIIKEFFICTGLVFVTLFILISFQYGCKQKGGEVKEIVVKRDTTHVFKSKIDTIISDKEKPFVSTMGCYLPPVVKPDTDVDDNVPKIVPPVIYLDDDEYLNNKDNDTLILEKEIIIKELDFKDTKNSTQITNSKKDSLNKDSINFPFEPFIDGEVMP